ncbi:hypothetical protein BH11CYA1_BH11CYA1_16930 [soil metagenome]
MFRPFNGFEIGYDSASRELDSISAPGMQVKAVSAGSESGDGKKHAAPKAADTRGKVEPDTGRPGIDDRYTQASRGSASEDERKTARKITEGILSGDKVSDTINSLDRDAKVRVMAEVKGRLAEQPGAKVSVADGSGADSSRSILIETAKGEKVLITESRMGSPIDIVAKGNGMFSKYTGATDVYDRPGETKAESSSGFNLREKLLGKPLLEGDGPLARVARGESITEAERADLEKKRLVYSPKDKTQ